MATKKPFVLAGREIGLGEIVDVTIEVSESFSGIPVELPVQVWRAPRGGPAVFVTAAIHGDELNGTGVVREIITERPFELSRGTLVLVPVVNLLGFERHSRYLPDRRDLNRCFPGSSSGSSASRLANKIFREIVSRCDFGIDIHSAAVRRTNFPNVRAKLRDPDMRRIATAFGCEIIVDKAGPKGSFRRAACDAGCPTIVLEAGEVWKIEPAMVELGVRGVRNVLIELGMVKGSIQRPAYQTPVRRTKWVRAELGGILQFHVAPGEVVEAGQPLATNTSLLGVENRVLTSPASGVILGMTTSPAVSPGDPVCHLGIPRKKIAHIREALDKAPEESLHERVRDDLATSVAVYPTEMPADDNAPTEDNVPAEDNAPPADSARAEPTVAGGKTRKPKLLPVIGWREWLHLPDLGIERIKAKIDTGARTSALHAFELEEYEVEGQPWVRFLIHPVQRESKTTIEVKAPLVGRKSVKPSTGQASVRPVVSTRVVLGRWSWPIEVTLVNRDVMGFRMLLGRRAFRRRFLIDPKKSFLAGEPTGRD